MMKNKKVFSGAIALALAAALMAAAYLLWIPQGTAGKKTITVTVVHKNQMNKEIEIHTEDAFLRGALDGQKLVEGEENDFGLFVKAVDGYWADDSMQEWWCFTKGGETLVTGIDTTPIADGDRFEITLTTGY